VKSTAPKGRIARAAAAAALALCGLTSSVQAATTEVSVLLITVDTLRADRMSGYGYTRPTSPNIDRLLADGARFTRARTVEPLTNPALSSMVTGMLPHEHGASRNGLRLEEGLDSLPKSLARHGWRTAAVVSNWTLKQSISNLGEHFDDYVEVFTRRRWFGLVNAEATGEDVTDSAIEWLDGHLSDHAGQPFLLWVHYVEPHAPYRFHDEHAQRLGIEGRDPPREDRYDTEIAAVDRDIGRLLEWLSGEADRRHVIIAFAADHGESLGEHGYWGHGRHLYEPSLHIPMGITWSGTIPSQVVEAPARIVDLASTVLELVGVPAPSTFRGVSWAGVLRGIEKPVDGAFCYQAHRGAVHGAREADRARSKGLLEVARVAGERKEILSVKSNQRWLFDLSTDPGELTSLADPGSGPSDELVRCVGEISTGLGSLDRLSTKKLDDETVEQLRALGYLE
jgi:arylsulfatase A-like enzyme